MELLKEFFNRIFSFPDTHACKELHKRSHRFALQNFQEVMNTEEFLLLPFQEVCILGKMYRAWKLNCPPPSKIFTLINDQNDILCHFESFLGVKNFEGGGGQFYFRTL